jgi:hydroxymethylglutaryl-CoA reductase
LLRGDDVAGRVAAANKLDAIAAALGQERTREVRRRDCISYNASDRDLLTILHYRCYAGTLAFSHR